MANENSSPFALLPAYLVLDTSASMSENDAFDSAFAFLPKLLAEMNKNSAIADKLRVEVLTFDEKCNVVFPLGTREELRRWLEEKEVSPIVPDGDWTFYGVAFDKLLDEIAKGVEQLRSESYSGQSYTVHRPVVFFITDGSPNDQPKERNEAFHKLTDADFYFRPNVICVGVGQAKREDLDAYGAGRYGSPSKEYITGNSACVLVAKDGVTPAAALSAIIPALIQSVLSATGNTWKTAGGEDEPDDMFGDLDDPLVDEEEDLYDLLAQDDL